jgi:hypothetical protein
MQKLLLSTQHKWMQMKRSDTNTQKMGRKSLSEFPKSNQHSQPKFRIGKTMSGMSIKWSYQKTFIAKQPYLGLSLCQLVCLHWKHKNKHGQICHKKDLLKYHHALGFQLSASMKAHLMGLIRQGIYHAQIMAHHKAYINEHVTRDTFVLPSNVKTWQRIKLMSYGINTPRIPSVSKCEFWKTLIWFFIMSNMPL